jgi:hypothetical protein
MLFFRGHGALSAVHACDIELGFMALTLGTDLTCPLEQPNLKRLTTATGPDRASLAALVTAIRTGAD